jgi:hypothetical protein
MDSQLSEGSAESAAPNHLARLRESIQSGNWQAASVIADGLAGCTIPRGRKELAEYLDALKQSVILAKSSRSVIAASLSRVRAAARFQS